MLLANSPRPARGFPLSCILWLFLAALLLPPALAHAQEPPYFVTYSSMLEEPGNLEIESQNIAAKP